MPAVSGRSRSQIEAKRRNRQVHQLTCPDRGCLGDPRAEVVGEVADGGGADADVVGSGAAAAEVGEGSLGDAELGCCCGGG